MAKTIADLAGTSCWTGDCMGLSRQLFAEVNRMEPGLLIDISGYNISWGDSAFPYLQRSAADSLKQVIAARNQRMSVVHAWRTLPAQYLLRCWYEQGRCGITAAAEPGNSNHERAAAVDVKSYADWKATFTTYGWRWQGSNDPSHFDKANVDLAPLGVQAFQRLHNRNAGGNLVEDGLYGPETEKALRAAPADGWPAEQLQQCRVQVNGLVMPDELAQAFIKAGSSYGSSRPVARAIGCDVLGYDEAAGWVRLRNNCGQERELPALFQDGTSYLKLASLDEMAGGFPELVVGWENSTGTVLLDT